MHTQHRDRTIRTDRTDPHECEMAFSLAGLAESAIATAESAAWLSHWWEGLTDRPCRTNGTAIRSHSHQCANRAGSVPSLAPMRAHPARMHPPPTVAACVGAKWRELAARSEHARLIQPRATEPGARSQYGSLWRRPPTSTPSLSMAAHGSTPARASRPGANVPSVARALPILPEPPTARVTTPRARRESYLTDRA